MKYSLLITFAVFLLLTLASAQKYSQRKRRSKEIEDRISKLDDATKKRINAMKASGMPKDAIAEKISYVAGGKNIAKRIVDALHDEPEAKAAKKSNTKTKATQPPKTPPKTAAKPPPSATKPAPIKNTKPSASAKRNFGRNEL
jgi:hypothetical protein